MTSISSCCCSLLISVCLDSSALRSLWCPLPPSLANSSYSLSCAFLSLSCTSSLRISSIYYTRPKSFGCISLMLSLITISCCSWDACNLCYWFWLCLSIYLSSSSVCCCCTDLSICSDWTFASLDCSRQDISSNLSVKVYICF